MKCNTYSVTTTFCPIADENFRLQTFNTCKLTLHHEIYPCHRQLYYSILPCLHSKVQSALNICYMKIIPRFRILELTEEHEH